jgi:hypothetical protein
MRRLSALLAIALLAAGCESFDVLSPQRTGALLRTIQIGMSEAEVTEHLGKPQRQEIRGDTKFLYYATPWQVAEKAKERSPIAIRDGRVVGFGNAYLAKFAPPEGNSWGAWLVEVRPEEEERVRYNTILAVGPP